MKNILILLSLITLSLSSIAQVANGKLKGTVTDEAQKPVESATVSLLKAKDSSVLRMAATDQGGFYSFENLSGGHYLLLITAVGHVQAYSPVFELNDNNPSLSLSAISLKPSTKDLKEVA